MKLKGSDSSRPFLCSDGLSKHSGARDYPPVTGMLSWTLHNGDNTIRILFSKIWLRLREKKNQTKHFSLLFSALSASQKAPAKASCVLRAPPRQDRQQLSLPLVYLRANPTNCSLFMLIYYTFSPLIKRLWSSKYCNNFYFPPPALFLSASFPPPPPRLHLFSLVAFWSTQEKAAKTNTHSVSPPRNMPDAAIPALCRVSVCKWLWVLLTTHQRYKTNSV